MTAIQVLPWIIAGVCALVATAAVTVLITFGVFLDSLTRR